MQSASRTRRIWPKLAKVGLFVLSVYTFILAIMLMKEGALTLVPLLEGRFVIEHVWQALGYGWFGAYLLMSGSPVAAAALVFLDAGAIDQLSTYMMVTGSRLGAGFFVFFLGFLYVLRGRDRANSLGMGLLSLSVTGSTYLVGAVIGLALLRLPFLQGIHLPKDDGIGGAFEQLFAPFLSTLTTYLPTWTLFPIGLIGIMISFTLFDHCLPQMTLRESHVGQLSRLVYQPWVMFILGAVITLISMSVSVTLGLLLPLSDRGFIRRENVIPYIMGANVTTFIDTLLVAVLLGNSEAISVILASMLSIFIVSALLLITIFRTYERTVLTFVGWTTATTGHLSLITGAILLVPILLILL